MGPTHAERMDHEVGHLPFRTWCGHCVVGKAAMAPHLRHRPRAGAIDDEGAMTISIDLRFLDDDRDMRQLVEDEGFTYDTESGSEGKQEDKKRKRGRVDRKEDESEKMRGRL